MGQHGSKSSIEARVLFERVGASDKRFSVYQAMNSTIRFQQNETSRLIVPHSTPHSTGRTSEKTRPRLCHRCDAGLEYVMDDPTGGVWVKPREKWRRS